MMLIKNLNLLGSILLTSLTLACITSCDKDNDTSKAPVNTVTLNMLNESNGKTLLGKSDVYINKSNNFRANSSFIAATGKASGVGARVEPQTGNLVKEAAVVPGHLYQVFDYRSLREFPSGEQAVQIGASYYQLYVASEITRNDESIGAVVKYFLAYPNAKGLPEWEHNIGTIRNAGESVEIALPKGAEYYFDGHHSSGDNGAFDVYSSNGKIVIQLVKGIDSNIGPYGTYKTYIRLGNVFTVVVFNVI